MLEKEFYVSDNSAFFQQKHCKSMNYYALIEDAIFLKQIIISTEKASDLKIYPRNQYIKFTLVYDKFTVPLIDPMNGYPGFQINLYSA